MVMEERFEEVFAHFGHSRSALLPCLKTLQDEYGCIPNEAIKLLSEKLNIAPLDIYGVISFYGMITTKNQGKYIVRVCSSLPCHLNSGDDLLEALQEELSIPAGTTTADKLFTLENVGCLGLCDKAPAMLINDSTYGPITSEQAVEVIADLRNKERGL